MRISTAICLLSAVLVTSASSGQGCDPNIGLRLAALPTSAPQGSHGRLEVRLDFDLQNSFPAEVAGWQWTICFDPGLTVIGDSEEPAYASYDLLLGVADFRWIAFPGADSAAFDGLEQALRDEAAFSGCAIEAFPGCGTFEGFLDLDPADLEDTGLTDAPPLGRTIYRHLPTGEYFVQLWRVLPDELAILWGQESKLNARPCPIPLNPRCTAGAAGIDAEISAFSYHGIEAGGPSIERGLILGLTGTVAEPKSIPPRNDVLDLDAPLRFDGPPGTYSVRLCGDALEGDGLNEFLVTTFSAARPDEAVNLRPCPGSANPLVVEILPPLVLRGDVNGDGLYLLSDPILLMLALFRGTQVVACPDAADFDDNGLLDLADIISSLTWRFADGPPPAPPYPACGADPTEDDLICGPIEACTN